MRISEYLNIEDLKFWHKIEKSFHLIKIQVGNAIRSDYFIF